MHKNKSLVNEEAYRQISEELSAKGATLIAVSKTKPVEDIQALYNIGQRDFGENYVQELVQKQTQLSHDIRWHFIGHLQNNKVKYIAPFVHLVQSIDNEKLLREVSKQAAKHNRTIDCLLQVHIAEEETKFGLNEEELELLINKVKTSSNELTNIRVKGLMGMASNTIDEQKIKSEFQHLKSLFDKYSSLSTTNCQFTTLSMGMSSDYNIAIAEGSNMVRIGSLLFGARKYELG